MPTAFITGARGFIGAALAECFRADGWQTIGVDVVADPDAGIVAGDIGEPGAWQAAAEGADAILHTAAVVSNAVGHDEQWRVNVLGTRRVIDAAVSGGVPRFVLFSSVRAFGDGGFPDGVDERWPIRPDGNAYVDTKVAAEQVALQAHAAREVEVTVIRPGDVYGPGSRPWVVLPLELVRSGRAVLPDGGRGIFSPVYIDDLVEGVFRAATTPEGVGEVFTFTSGEHVTTLDYFGHLSRMAGKGEPRTAPLRVLVAAAAATSRIERLRGAPSENTPETLRYLVRDGTYSSRKAREVLGWEPQVMLPEGMRRVEEWAREQGLLSS